MKIEHLARVRKEDAVQVARITWLKNLDGVVPLGDTVRQLFLASAISRINLLPKHRTFERTTGFSLFFRSQPIRQNGIVEQRLFLEGIESRLEIRIILRRRSKVLVRHVQADGCFFHVSAGVKPRLSVGW